MWEWIVLGVLYVLLIALFRILGGVNSAGEALSAWGRAVGTIRMSPGSSS